MLDNDRLYFTITDLKQYIYCPRIFYYHACLPDIRPITYKMQAGINAHANEPKRAARRTLGLEASSIADRHFDVAVQSDSLQLTGQIDEVIQTETEWFPVDYKLARTVGFHFKVQLTAYALLLEDHLQISVKRGFVYLISKRETVEVPITSQLRQTVLRSLKDMQRIAQTEHMPLPTDWRQRCVDCEFRRFCNDV